MPDVCNNLITKKIVSPEAGHILNDNDNGVDYLGHTVYANALADTISNVKTPVTVGLFASWGSGKSFLLKHVTNILNRYQRQNDRSLWNERKPTSPCAFWTSLVVLILLFLAFLVWSVMLLLPLPIWKVDTNRTQTGNSTAVVKRPMSLQQILSVVNLSLIALIISVCILTIACCQVKDSFLLQNLRLLLMAAFAKLPVDSLERCITKGDKDVEIEFLDKVDEGDPTFTGEHHDDKNNTKTKPKRYVFVHFNAWAYAGSDNLWAGIVTNLADAIEAEFGLITSRIFRLMNVETVSRDLVGKGAKNSLVYANFKRDTLSEELEEILHEFGVVFKIEKYSDYAKGRKGNKKKFQDVQGKAKGWFVIHYSCRVEAECACAQLNKEMVESLLDDPFTMHVTKPTGDENDRTPMLAPNNGHTQLNEMNNTTQPTNSTAHQKGREMKSEADDIPACGFWQLFSEHPKTVCCIPLLWIAIFLILLILAPCILATIVTQTSGAFAYLAWIPAALATLYSTFQFLWAMFHSQTARITRALNGTKENMASELGLMSKIKEEVDVISKLIQFTEFSHQKEYKVIITIDDLDRISLGKVKSVLEAVSILLSDRSSPFVCIVAVDSRIAVKCIEDGMGEALLETKISGHEYLKKIINLPFCLPEVEMKTNLIDGLMEQADRAKTVRGNIQQEGNTVAVDGIGHSNNDGSSDNSDTLSNVHSSGSERVVPDSGVSSSNAAEDTPSASRMNSSFSGERSLGSFPRSPEPVGFASRSSSEDSGQTDAHTLLQTRDRIKTPFLTSIAISSGHDVVDAIALPSLDGRLSQHFEDRISFGRVPSQLKGFLKTWDESGETQGTGSIAINENAPAERAGDNTDAEKKKQEELLTCKQFFCKCREFFRTDEETVRHLHGNPRSIKRIFNIISLNFALAECEDKEKMKSNFDYFDDNLDKQAKRSSGIYKRSAKFAEELVRWIVLTEQWPYRMSYLIQVIDDADQRSSAGRRGEKIDDAESLHYIYEKYVCHELRNPQYEKSRMLAVDGDPDIFFSFLKTLGSQRMSKSTAKKLQRYSINLDQSLRQNIAHHRSMMDIERRKFTDQLGLQRSLPDKQEPGKVPVTPTKAATHPPKSPQTTIKSFEKEKDGFSSPKKAPVVMHSKPTIGPGSPLKEMPSPICTSFPPTVQKECSQTPVESAGGHKAKLPAGILLGGNANSNGCTVATKTPNLDDILNSTEHVSA